MAFGFPRRIAHAARTWTLGAGSIVGSGTVRNRDRRLGSSCIAEQRTIETLEAGQPKTPFLSFGDRVRIEMPDPDGCSIFGAIDRKVVLYAAPACWAAGFGEASNPQPPPISTQLSATGSRTFNARAWRAKPCRRRALSPPSVLN